MTKNEDLNAFDAWADDYLKREYPFYTTGAIADVCRALKSQLYAAWKAGAETRHIVNPDDVVKCHLKGAACCGLTAMEDNTGRSGSNGMASVEGSTPSLPNPSPTDGDAESPLKTFEWLLNHGSYLTDERRKQAIDLIRTALQSTRTPPSKGE